MKDKKDILFLCQFFYPEYVSSATLPYDTAEYLKKCGFKVGCLCGYPKEYSNKKDVKTKEIHNGIFIKRLRYLQFSRRHFLGRLTNYVSFLISSLLNVFELRKYKIIFVYSNPPILPFIAIIGKKLFGNKIVFISYDVYPEIAIVSGAMNKDGIMSRIFQKINVLIFRNADMTIAVSKDMEEYLIKERNIKRENITTIPNWYEKQNKKDFGQTKILNDIPSSAFVLAYLGNLGVCQDEKILIEVMRKLKSNSKIYFVVAGHGVKMDKLRSVVIKEELKHVRVLGFLHGDDYLTVLNRSNAFIVTLIPGLKGLCAPSKAYACLMAGKPVFTVMDSGMEIMRDIGEEGAGIALLNGQFKELEKNLIELQEDPQKCFLMGKKARKIFLEKYEKEICLRQYKELAFKLLELDGGKTG